MILGNATLATMTQGYGLVADAAVEGFRTLTTPRPPTDGEPTG